MPLNSCFEILLKSLRLRYTISFDHGYSFQLIFERIWVAFFVNIDLNALLLDFPSQLSFAKESSLRLFNRLFVYLLVVKLCIIVTLNFR